MDKAITAHQAGRLDEAIRRYDRVIAGAPGHADALFMRGTARIQQGALSSAVEDLDRAIQARPGFAKALNNLGIALGQLGRAAEAAASFEEALLADPNYAEAPFNQGNAWSDAGEHAEATDSYRRALALQPIYPEAQLGLGNALRDLGRPEEAETAFRQALAGKPGWPTALNNLGTALHDQGRVRKAAGFYQRAVAAKPDHVDGWINLGNAWLELGQPANAQHAYGSALAVDGESQRAWAGLGNCRTELGAADAAVKAYRKALDCGPATASVLATLAAGLRRVGDLDEAISCAKQALDADPSLGPARATLVQALQHACAWDELDEAAQDPRLADVESPFLSLTLSADPPRNLRAARRRSEKIDEQAKRLGVRLEVAAPGPRQRLRIGYLSADFHGHATAHLMAGLFERHDRARFEIQAYSYGPDDDSPWRRRIVAGADAFIDVAALNPSQAAACIAEAGVDILVDLKGHTEKGRPLITALRPAPVQVAWLGFPGSTGAESIDYALTDAVVTPDGSEADWTEALVRLPGCYQVTDPDQRISTPGPTRQESGLPAGGFVFCSFNQPYKIERRAWDAWMGLLRGQPEAVLWLLAGAETAHARLRQAAADRQVDPGRLVFAPPTEKADHLARIRLADLALDTFTVNGHTTTSDALRAGVPVVTLEGRHFASRVASSVLRAAALAELVTTSEAEYARLASEIAQDPEMLAELRARLSKSEQTPLFDATGFARKLETAYLVMWNRACPGIE